VPTYDFKDTTTGKVFTEMMKIAERDQYLASNPHIQPVLSAPSLVDPVSIGVRKIDGGFREVLAKIHEKTPGSRLNTTADI